MPCRSGGIFKSSMLFRITVHKPLVRFSSLEMSKKHDRPPQKWPGKNASPVPAFVICQVSSHVLKNMFRISILYDISCTEKPFTAINLLPLAVWVSGVYICLRTGP